MADSAYEYLTIGNFFNHDETLIEERMGQPTKQPQGKPTDDEYDTDIDETEGISYLAYYFLDDVRLYLCPSVNNTATPPKGQ